MKIMQFGGSGGVIENLSVQPINFRTIVHHGTKSVVLKWENPADENFSAVKIVRKTGSIPTTIRDGLVVYSGNAEEYTDIDASLEYETTYYYRIFALNGYSQPQMIPAGSIAAATIYDYSNGLYLSDVKIGELINFGRYRSTDTATLVPLQWRVVDKQNVADGVVTVALETDTGNKRFDMPESGNTGGRENYGNNRWLYSNIRQWLNSDGAAGAWYEAQHGLDQPSEYKSNHGFLHSFTEDEKRRILLKTNKIRLANVDGGGTETTQEKIWLPSAYEVGLAGTTADFTIEKYPDTQKVFEYFNTVENRIWREKIWWLRTLYSGVAYLVRFVSATGALGHNGAVNSCGVRPFCNLQSLILLAWDDETQAYNYLKESAE